MRYTVWIFGLIFALIGPNLIWLAASTVRIHNGAGQRISSVAYVACEKVHPIGELEPDESIFRFLPKCGDDTLEILVATDRFCRSYVEGELYHLDATITAGPAVTCGYDDLLSSLFVAKALW